MNEEKYNLENRLIDYAVRVIRLTEALPRTTTGSHIRGQLVRSGTSPAPNYAEAQSAESCTDFVHKLKVALKELRESELWQAGKTVRSLRPENQAAEVSADSLA